MVMGWRKDTREGREGSASKLGIEWRNDYRGESGTKVCVWRVMCMYEVVARNTTISEWSTAKND